MSPRLAIAASVVIAIAVGFGYGAFISRSTDSRPGAMTRLNAATVLPVPQELPAFALHDAAGTAFGPTQLTGNWSLLFFGFASCGDVCPTTLYTLVEATSGLDIKPRIVFLSVDPERDTDAVLTSYVAGFDVEMLGVTGEDAQIRTLAGALGVSYRVMTEPDAYLVEHSPAVFVINPDGRYVAVFTSPTDALAIAKDLRTIAES